MSSVDSGARKIVVISGPTGSGKSSFGVELAEKFNGEILSADSVAVYKHFNVGSAKPDLDTISRVPHHLISALEPEEDFSAGEFGVRGKALIEEIFSRGKVPFVVGGTGLYIRALLNGMVKDKLEPLNDSVEVSHLKLKEVDPVSAAKIHPNDTFRIKRALEHFIRTGISIELSRSENNSLPLNASSLIFVIEPKREILYEQINSRCRLMLDSGLIKETEGLLERYSSSLKPFGSIGYSHAVRFLSGELKNEAELFQELSKDTRRFAKRQLTWWRNQSRALGWVEIAELEQPFDVIKAFLEDKEDLSQTPRVGRVCDLGSLLLKPLPNQF